VAAAGEGTAAAIAAHEYLTGGAWRDEQEGTDQ
jgi:hypothetical protein